MGFYGLIIPDIMIIPDTAVGDQPENVLGVHAACMQMPTGIAGVSPARRSFSEGEDPARAKGEMGTVFALNASYESSSVG